MEPPSNEVLAERFDNLKESVWRELARLSANQTWYWRILGALAVGVIYAYVTGEPGPS